jgi:hydroxyethylthiazole kinase-like uncharacterized protein yjeF
MEPVLTVPQMAQLDNFTVEQFGLDARVLMSNAAREVLRCLLERWPDARRLLILCGTGNNGGDGLALAYYAQQQGLSVLAVMCRPGITDPPLLPDAAEYYYKLCQRTFVPVELLAKPALLPEVVHSSNADVIVDAVFGIGIKRPLEEYFSGLFDRLNQTSRPIVSIDCPSGLECSNATELGPIVTADLTVTMGYPKRGFFHPRAGQYLGEIVVAPLGFAGLAEAGVEADCFTWGDAMWDGIVRPRAAHSHKGDYGRVLVVAGHARYPGAPRLAARGALRAGAGLVRLVVPEPIFSASSQEAAVMTFAHSSVDGGFAAQPDPLLLEFLQQADALVIGPGMSDAPGALRLAEHLLNVSDLPTVVDADALRALPSADEDQRRWPLVLTPHVGELARMIGRSVDDTLADWFTVAGEMAQRAQALLVAKSNQTLLAMPDGGIILPRCGHPALATGGTGDVLAGMIGALLARLKAEESPDGLPTRSAVRLLSMAEVVCTAVNWHAATGELGAELYGENCLTAGDLPDLLPEALRAMIETTAGL